MVATMERNEIKTKRRVCKTIQRLILTPLFNSVDAIDGERQGKFARNFLEIFFPNKTYLREILNNPRVKFALKKCGKKSN